MTGLIAVLVVAALVFWLFGGRRAAPEPAPEDDVATPIDEEELADAEAELEEAEAEVEEELDPRKPDDDDDWGPGAGRR